jgi:hypothetical protein
MAKFLNRPRIEHMGGKSFMLLASLDYECDLLGVKICVPLGTYTDFASIPFFAQSICQVLGDNIPASIVHDYLCREEGKEAYEVTQAEADLIFLEAMESKGVRLTKRRLMFRMVQGFQKIKYLFKKESYK